MPSWLRICFCYKVSLPGTFSPFLQLVLILECSVHSGSVELQVSALASLPSLSKPTKSRQGSRGVFLTVVEDIRAPRTDRRVLELEKNLEVKPIGVLSQTRGVSLSDF